MTASQDIDRMPDSASSIKQVCDLVIDLEERCEEIRFILLEERCPQRRELSQELIETEAKITQQRRIIGYQRSINVDGEMQ